MSAALLNRCQVYGRHEYEGVGIYLLANGSCNFREGRMEKLQ